jgi:hypothetical protein
LSEFYADSQRSPARGGTAKRRQNDAYAYAQQQYYCGVGTQNDRGGNIYLKVVGPPPNPTVQTTFTYDGANALASQLPPGSAYSTYIWTFAKIPKTLQ